MSPVAWIFAASLATNAALGWAWLGARDDVAVARSEVAAARAERAGAQQAADACSTSVKALGDLAEARQGEAAAAREAARAATRRAAQRADRILAAPPAVPGDDCRSAAARASAWLAERAGK